MDTLRDLMPAQAEIASFYSHGVDEVVEWEDGRFNFTVTLYHDDVICWDVYMSYSDDDVVYEHMSCGPFLDQAIIDVLEALNAELKAIRERQVADLTGMLDRIIDKREVA
jgi:hypothetical protein